MRTEKDSLGEWTLSDDILYGINTARAIENFRLEYKRVDQALIYALVQVKRAAAVTYRKLGVGKPEVYDALVRACDVVLSGAADDSFVTEALQGGAGTSTNMNANEVLANLAFASLAALWANTKRFIRSTT